MLRKRFAEKRIAGEMFKSFRWFHPFCFHKVEIHPLGGKNFLLLLRDNQLEQIYFFSFYLFVNLKKILRKWSIFFIYVSPCYRTIIDDHSVYRSRLVRNWKDKQRIVNFTSATTQYRAQLMWLKYRHVYLQRKGLRLQLSDSFPKEWIETRRWYESGRSIISLLSETVKTNFFLQNWNPWKFNLMGAIAWDTYPRL